MSKCKGGGGRCFNIIFWGEGLYGKYDNYLAGKENYNSFLKLELEVAIFKAQDRKKILTQIHGPQQLMIQRVVTLQITEELRMD